MLGSPRAFRDDYLIFVYGRKWLGKGGVKITLPPPKKKKKSQEEFAPESFRMIVLSRL